MAQSLASLPVGATVKFGTRYGAPIQWYVGEHSHNGYPANSTVLVSKYVLDIKAFDGFEPANPSLRRTVYGNSRYMLSNIRQWLNSSATAGNWYTPQHSADEPPTNNRVDYNPYYNQEGFLYEWNKGEASYLLDTSHQSALASIDGTADTITDKIFLMSMYEAGISSSSTISVGSKIALFNNSSYRVATLTSGAASHSNSYINAKTGQAVSWLTCSASRNGFTSTIELVNEDGQSIAELEAWAAYDGYDYSGVRPACCVSSQTLVTDSTDSDGCYSVIVNSAPSTVSSLDVPDTLYILSDTTINWGRATDPDGNLAGYILEYRADGAAWTQIYKGSARSFTHNIAAGVQKAQYRVKAYDSYGVESAYVTSVEKSVNNNHAPTITGSYGDLGTFSSSGPSMTYQCDDFDADTCRLAVILDGKTYKTLVPVLGESATFTFSADEWLKVLNGAHTLTLKVSDTEGESAQLDATFTKKVTSVSFVKKLSVNSDKQPTRGIFNVNGNFPTGSTLKVEACNNGDDETPVWEDVTEAVSSGIIYTFTNSTKTSDKWGVKVRVTLTRGTATDDVYVSSIGGNFEEAGS